MEDEPPSKRLRTEPTKDVGGENDHSGKKTNLKINSSDSSEQHEQVQKEIRAGITAYVDPDAPGFTGILKKRYTDFLVNEVLPDRQVLHLRSLDAPTRKAPGQDPTQVRIEPTEKTLSGSSEHASSTCEKKNGTPEDPRSSLDFQLADEDRQELDQIFGSETVQQALSLHQRVLRHPGKKPRDLGYICSPSISSKEMRTLGHQAIRRIFSSMLNTQTSDDDTISISAASRSANPVGGNTGKSHDPHMRGRLGWDDLGGQYIHFTLYKENRDTMEAIYFLAQQMKVDVKRFAFSGTKDRRAVTVQRASGYRMHAEQLANIGKRLKQSKIGDFEYSQTGCELGDLGGNEFVVCLRDCQFKGDDNLNQGGRMNLAEKVVSDYVVNFRERGFINYYGLQRFGSFSTSTDGIGMKMLKGDLQGAVNSILEYSQEALAAAHGAETGEFISSDDKKRAEAIHLWQTTQDTHKALDLLPKKFSGESNVMRYLGHRDKRTGQRPRENDFQGALRTIPRNLRLMYMHAYQSLVWNAIAGERWNKYGPQVVEGDLVIIDKQSSKKVTADDDVDEEGEAIVRPAADDSATSAEDAFVQARPLTAAEATGDQFSIFDIVLPMPGFDVEYPPNAIGQFYRDFMASERGGGLDPHNMRRSWKDASLSGGYRHLLARPGPDMSYEVRSYAEDDQQLLETDLQRLEKQGMSESGQSPVVIEKADSEMAAEDGQSKRVAVILKFQLGSGQYATMALRELMGAGGVITYKPDYGGR